MKLYNIDADVGEREIKRNVAEGQSEKEKKGRLRKLGEKLLDSTKRTTQVLAVAVGMTVMAYGCGGKVHPSGDVDIDNIEIVDGVDVENDSDGIEDILDSEDVEVETNCIGPSEPLEGEIDPFIANSEDGVATLNGSDSEILGDTKVTVGGEVSGELLILGECPNDSTSIAAFGAQDRTVDITPQYRLDFGENTFYAELPDVDSDVCSPPEVDNVPVSMYLDETNLAVKKATVGSVNTRGEFGFVTPLIPIILVNGSESASPVLLGGSGYEVEEIMVSLENPLLEMAAKVYSNTGEEILEREVQGSGDAVNSKTLRVYQLGSSDLILPTINWDTSPTRWCFRSESGEEKELAVEISGEARGVVNDSCGEKVFASFDINGVTANIVDLNPPHLIGNYSIVSSSGSGVESMVDDSTTITLMIKRTPNVADFGEIVLMEVRVEGNLISVDASPVTGAVDNIHFSLPIITIIDPDVGDYSDECGYFPGGIF